MLVEADLFLVEGRGSPEYHVDQIRRIIDFRLDKPRPIIVESIGLFHLLEELGRAPDVVIYCCSDNYEPDDELCGWFDRYEQQYDPKLRADIVLDLTE